MVETAATVKFSLIVCAYNEEQLLPDCLRSLLRQSVPPGEIFVINHASTDRTAEVASIPGVRVVDEPRKGLVIARETGRRVSTGDVLVYVDADCRAGRVRLTQSCWVFTSARRYKTMGRGKVFRLYVRNFCSEIFFHRPSDTTHEDVRS